MDRGTTVRPPATRAEIVEDLLHGVRVVDEYRWLEGDNSNSAEMGRVTAEVAAWTDAHNAYTRELLDRLPGRAALENRLRPLLETGSVSLPDVQGRRCFYAKREGSQNQPVIYWRDGVDAPDRVLIDPAALDPSGLTTVEWISPSQDGTRLAFGTFRAGDENTILRLIDVDAGATLPLEIPNKTQSPDWLPDGSGFVYHNLADHKDPYTGRIRFHRLGTDPAGDAVIFRQFTREEDAALATTWGPFASLSEDGRWLLLGYWIDTRSNDLWLLDFDRWRQTGDAPRRVVSVGVAGLASGTVIDDVIFLQTTKGAPNGRVVAASVADPEAWRVVVPERPDAVIEGVAFGKGVIAVTYLRDAASVVEVFGLDGRPTGALAQPGIGTAAVAAEQDRTEAFLQFTSFNYPTTIFRVDLAAPASAPVKWAQPEAPVDPETVEVEQVWYPSKDGTRVSMFLVHGKGLQRSPDTPTILEGYGGFNINLTPAFTPSLFQWFEAGGLYAMPNLRGGGEYGDAWHEAGMLERKQNTFDDFIAAAEWLIATGRTSSEKLAIRGGSNGGLLTGAVITQRPELVRAAIIAVPLLDMLRYQDFLMARYWVPEYGTAEDPDQFAVLLRYSPYHRIVAGTRYPAVFLTAGEYDTRVHAMHARKMAARLQAATASDPAERPVLLWVDREAGHGQGKPLNLRLRDAVDQRLFLMWQLGMLPATS
ncbi:MAG TPA: prolyl oligopeptidase family serine peptidase [Vicinamibacterales bacterium]|nr:prolyl oligopeptidase family serine peptidase [Vicinamibacterales bacterium]